MSRREPKALTRADWICAALLTLIAAIPRLCCLGLAEFKLDEATHYQLAYQLTHGAWQWVGSTSSMGIPKPPLFVYALALPMTFSRDPRVITGFLGVLAALAAGGFYLILRRFLNRPAAFGSALLFALNPQAVLYARKLFTADLLPPLCTAFLGAATAFLRSPRERVGRWALLTALTFALLLLNTLSPFLLVPALLALFWQRRHDLSLSGWLGTGLALVLPFVPYLIRVIPTIPGVLTQAGASSTQPPMLAWIWSLAYGAGYPDRWDRLPGLLALLTGGLYLGGLLWLIRAWRRPKDRSWATFFIAWLGLAPLLGFILPIDFKAHYLVVLYPLLFVLPGGAIELAYQRSRRAGWLLLTLVFVIGGWQAQNWRQTLAQVAAGVEGYGTPLHYWWRAAEEARNFAREHQAAEVLLVMPGDQTWDEKAHVLDALLSDTPHRVINGYSTLLYPPHTTLFLVASEVEQALTLLTPCSQQVGQPLEASPFGGSYHYRFWEGDTLLTDDQPSASACGLMTQPAGTRWASGSTLIGYSLTGDPQPGGTLHIVLHWSAPQASLGQEVHWFNHLLNQEEQTQAQFDTLAWPGGRWQSDEFIHAMTYFDLTLAPEASPGPYTLRVGQYTYPDMQNIPVLDQAGNPAAYAAEFPITLP